MKLCSECGKKLKDSAEFCYNCGAPCDNGDLDYMKRRADYRRESLKAARKNKSRSLIFNIWSVLMILLVLALMFTVWYLPSRRAYMDVMQGNTVEAKALFHEKVESNTLQRFIIRMMVPRGAAALVNAYDQRELTYTDAVDRLKTLAEFEEPLNNASKAAEKLETLHTSAEAARLGAQYESEGDTLNALLAYRMVSENDSNYDTAVQKIAELEGQYKSQVITEAGSPTTEQDFLKAEALLQNALEVIPGDVKLQDQLTTIRQAFAGTVKTEAMSKATDYISKGYYKQAIDILDRALVYNEGDLELKTLKETAVRNYEDFVRSQVSVYLGNNDKKGAKALLKRASADMPDSTTVKQLTETVNNS